jgi:L-threonylcarbamoyladenylate synthase
MLTLPLLSLDESVRALTSGMLLVFPTETLYGLGCNAMNVKAVEAVFRLKRRPLDKALPLIIGAREQFDLVAQPASARKRRIMDAFWPGPLSLLCQARSHLPGVITAGSGRVALRLSSHPAARLLCRESGLALVATSANISEQPAPVRLEELDARLVKGVAGVFYMPPEPSGDMPSTVVDILEEEEDDALRILRPGAVSEDALHAAGFAVRGPTLSESGVGSGYI